MTEEDAPTYLPLKVIHVGIKGKRTFDPEGKHRLIEACRRPGVLISGMALKANVNANQLHKWIREALHYLHGQWPELVRYVENGTWLISNTPCENSIRPFVVGRCNFLFCDSVAGANASNLYSIVETCKANGADAYQYLVALFKAPPRAQTVDDYEALLPWNLKPSATA